jgi:hypothetical protein
VNFRHFKFSLCLFAAVAACADQSPDSTTSPAMYRAGNVSAAAEKLISAAVAGARPRGPQDEMLKLENELPGFGGFYIDSVDNVVVYLKTGSTTSPTRVRNTLASFYATWPNPREREIMRASVNARIVTGDYSLSELIATENMIASRLLSTPGIVGVGTSLRLNRVKVGFRNEAAIAPGVNALVAAGALRDRLVAEVWGDVIVSSSFTDKIRNTKAGIQIAVGRRRNPYDSRDMVELGSHGFVVTANGTKYLMTASHLANQLWGQNGKTADTVFQNDYDVLYNNKVATIAISAAWLQGTACPQDSTSQAYPDFCTQSDIALAAFNGADGDKKIATSTYEGQNGNAGTSTINGFYSIAGVLSPEFVKDSSDKGVHKSGYKTGTTTGVIDLPITQLVVASYSWGNFLQSSPWVTKSVIWYNVTRVAHMGWGGGDSGAAVFAGNGSPYYALGSQFAGTGTYDQNTICNNGTSCAVYFTRWSKIEQDLGFSLNPITGQ